MKVDKSSISCYTCYTEGEMIAVRLPENLEKKLEQLAAKTNRTKSYYMRKALEEYLEDEADYLLAIERIQKDNPRISLDEMEKRLGLAD
jgi:RHH-type rel operon transcriptional repressor/antitoxin RelB